MSMIEQLARFAAAQPNRLLFATVSGAHLYGFPSPDSDYDLRGVHVLPLRDVVGLREPDETIEVSGWHDGIELDLVTHDVRKFFNLLLKPNGYVLEQLTSPLIVQTSPEHEYLKAIATGCITRHHSHHYFGFSRGQWDLFLKDNPRRVKPLLYVYRVLLTGIHLMQTGEIEANLLTLNAGFRLPYIDELVARKLAGAEHGTLDDADVTFHRAEFERLTALLVQAEAVTTLPSEPTCRPALNDLLIQIRLGEFA